MILVTKQKMIKLRKIKNLSKKFVAPLILILLPLLFFNQALIGNIIVSGDFSGSDLLNLHLPFKFTLHNNFTQGKLPLWEPNLSLGFPVFAEGQSGPLYPIHILFSFFPAHLSLILSIIATFALAGIFTYIYARSLKLNRFSALFSATTFAFSAFFVTRLKHLNMIAVAAWMPFLFWTTKKFFSERKLRYAVLAGLGIALQFLAGHPQMAFFCLLIFLIYFLFEFSLSIKEKGFSDTFPLSSLALFIIAVIALGLSAVQLLPTLELTSFSERQEYTFQTATAYPFHPKNLMTFISPYYFGNPATGSYRENINTTGVFWENVSYIGLLPLILAFWAIISALRKKPRPPHHLFFIGLALFSLIMMLGRFTPFYNLLWQLVPGFQLFRFPTRFNLFLILSLSILSGSGAQFLLTKLLSLKDRPQLKNQETARFTWPIKSLPTQILIFAFLVLDLYVFASSYLAYIPLNKFLKEPEIVMRLREDETFFRIYSLTQYGQNPYGALGWKKDQNAILAIKEAIPANDNVFYNLDSFTDRAWFEGGLGLKRRHRLENFLIKENQSPVLTGKILGTYNVKYIISFAEALGIEIEKIEEYDLGEQFATTLKLFKNNQAIPRTLFIPEAEVISDEEAVFRKVIELEFLPTKTVILEKQPKKIPPQFNGALDKFREENPAEITSYNSQEVIIKADTKVHGFLVLSDLNYPGWKAQVDGKEQEILQANYLVRALELEPGNHTIRFFFDPLSFKIGSIISLSSLAVLASFSLIHIALKLKKNKKP